MPSLDLSKAVNAISDIAENRPLPLREFDQIYMKAGDLVVHTEFVARRFAGREVVFVGDGDAVGLAMIHLMNEGIIQDGPQHVTVLDFDERMVNTIRRFAADYECENRIAAVLYNVVDPVPQQLVSQFGAFHINPPWGQHNGGESVVVFLERAIQMLSPGGLGAVVIADDSELPWTNQVLGRAQTNALQNGMIVEEMIPALHAYHLDDAPDLRSCALLLRKVGPDGIENEPLTGARLEDFYGRSRSLRVQYVREIPELWRRRADDRTYQYEILPE